MVREKLVIDDKDREADYVYDLYYIEEGQLDLSGELSGGSPEQELLLEHFVSQEEEEDETYEDDSDSNDEANWRNDYPEDEPDKSEPRKTYLDSRFVVKPWAIELTARQR